MNIVITGVSGGMGLETAIKYTSLGHRVYGLDIKAPSKKLDNFTFIKCDLTDEKDVKKAFDFVNKKETHIDSLISLAGIYDLNSLVEMSEEEFIRIFNINVFGIYRLNKYFLPLLNKNSKIFIVSSELGPLDPLPFTGIYGITKSTIEKYAYSLRMELQLLDIKVVVIRPGAVDTTLLDVTTQRLDKFAASTTHYQENANTFRHIVESVESKKVHPSKIANLIYKVDQKKKSKYVYALNRNPLLLILNSLP
jgi:NAD(P)-dependent dehydrogenase (short-subunit alcohol dehydrogenase family)